MSKTPPESRHPRLLFLWRTLLFLILAVSSFAVGYLTSPRG